MKRWHYYALAGAGLGAVAMMAGGGGVIRPIRIAAIGDSITASADGYVHAIGRELGVPAHAVGYPGAGAAFIRLQAGEALKVAPSHVLILAGVNDLASGRRWQDTAGEIAGLVGRIRGAGARVVVIGVTPWAGYQGGRRYDAGEHAALNQALASIAATLGQSFVDTAAMGDAEGRLPAMYGADGLHLNATGHARLAQIIMQRMGWAS